ncbi:MAG TPA: sigma-70 family RNA polymerase sigma factor [Fimbriiglobus sp.]|jgi:RNA polymerase sigma factor (sigma-70 family)
MPRPSWSLFDRLIRRLPPAEADRVPDAELLARFVRDRDQAAFELLVWRHGGLVLGVCRRVVGDDHLAEDAFQATFLVLARKAQAIRADNVPGWLHRVARRAATKAARRRRKLQARETVLAAESFGTHPFPDPDRTSILDAEIGHLPERFRLPIVLCYLQNHTTAQAAQLLRVPQGTVLSRLATARQRLSARLTQRGVTLSAVLVTATVSDQLVSATVAPAAAYAAGEAVLTSAPTLLATEVIRMSAWKLPATIALAMVLTVGVGSGVAWVQGGAGTGQATAAAGETLPAPRSPWQVTREMQTPPLTEEQKYVKLIEATFRVQIESLKEYITDREKENIRLNTQLFEKTKARRELSVEELPSFLRRADAVRDGVTTGQSEIKRQEQMIAEREMKLKQLQEFFAQDSKFTGSESKIDPNSRDGIRLGVMYRKQAELESKVREMTIKNKGMKANSVPEIELSNTKEELVLLLSDIEKLEKLVRYQASDLEHIRLTRDFERNKREIESEIQLTRMSIVWRVKQLAEQDHKLLELTKTGAQIAILDGELSVLRDNIAKVQADIKVQQDKKNKLVVAMWTSRVRPPDLKLEQIVIQLAEIQHRIGGLEFEMKKQNVLPNKKK